MRRHLHTTTERLRYAGIAALLALAGAPAGRADAAAEAAQPDVSEMSLEELTQVRIPVVTTASLHEEKVTESPASVSLVTSDEIRRLGYRTLAEVLAAQPGFYTTSDDNYTYLGTRGILRPGDLSTRFLFLVDGHRVNDAVYDQLGIGTEGVVDTELIDHVEIVRGPGSALYGSNAFLGVINVVTRAGADLGGLEAAVSGGSGRTLEGRVAYGREFAPGWDVIASASRMFSRGRKRLYFPEYDAPETNDGVAVDMDDDAYQRAFVKVAHGGLTVSASYSHREKGVPTGSYDTVFNDSRSRTVDQWAFLHVSHVLKLDAEWQLDTRVALDAYRFTGIYPIDYPPVTLDQDNTHGRSWTLEERLRGPVGTRHTFTVGAEYRRNPRQDQREIDQEPFFLYLDSRASSHALGVFVQDEVALGPRVKLDLGVRHDRTSTFGSTTHPRIAVVYAPDVQQAFKLMYGTAFRAPSAYELYYMTDSTGGTQRLNPDLQPERIRSLELAWERFVGSRLRVGASLFRYDITGQIAYTATDDGALMYDNIDRARSQGVELSVQARAPGGLWGSASYTYADAHENGASTAPPNSPRHVLGGRIFVPLHGPRIGAALEARYLSARRTLAGGTVGGAALCDVVLGARALPGDVDVSLAVRNAFDRRYADPASAEFRQEALPQPGRSVRVTVTFHARRAAP